MKTWVADVPESEADQKIVDWTALLADHYTRTGAKYVKGPSRSGETGQVGIYFDDPTNKGVAP